MKAEGKAKNLETSNLVKMSFSFYAAYIPVGFIGMKSPPTLRSLAILAGVHHSTLSRALRDDPRLAVKTRRKLRALAEAEGYRPDALISRGMMAMQRGRVQSNPEMLGLLTSTTRMGEGEEPFQAFCRTISKRAMELGYCIDELWMREPKMTTKRMNKIILSRGIEGIIIPPNFSEGGKRLSLNLAHVAVVQHCHAIWRPQLHRVEPHNFQNMMTVMKELTRRKYRRIGLVQLLGLNRATGHEWEGAYHYYHATHPQLARLKNPTFSCEGFDDAGLLKWVKAEKPDVLVGPSVGHLKFFRDNGYRIPEDIGLVSMSVNAWDLPLAGINLRAEEIDRAAVDVVVGQINRNERGVPKVPRNVMIEGIWQDGPTVRKV